MRATLPLLVHTEFPPIRRARLETLQVNVGYRCNQSCLHCHVSAGPRRTEDMTRETARHVVAFMEEAEVETLDVTGGAPELNASFRYLVSEARRRGVAVIDRCNLTILLEPGQEDLAQFLAANRVSVVASLPCYLEDNVNAQRGAGVFAASIAGLRRLNALGYGRPDSGLSLDLVYNPQGPSLPPPQDVLEATYRSELAAHGVEFNHLLTLANMPIGRFGSTLVSRGQFGDYLRLLKGAHNPGNLRQVMCRSLVSVDWEGYLYDCDFNQMLGLPLRIDGVAGNGAHDGARLHLTDLAGRDLQGLPITVGEHCFGCTAGQGSSCGGALA